MIYLLYIVYTVLNHSIIRMWNQNKNEKLQKKQLLLILKWQASAVQCQDNNEMDVMA